MRAMLLAAGRGERMRPLTDHTPKPLLPVGGKPLAQWHIERLVRAGITDIIINHAWLGHQIEQQLGDGSRWGARLAYSPEPNALETAGGIANALPFFGNEPFLVINGDVWCDWNPAEALATAQLLRAGSSGPAQTLAWLLLVNNPAHHPGGDFALAPDGKVACLPGQPASPDRPSARAAVAASLTFSGIGIYHPALFNAIPAGERAALGPVLRHAMGDGKVLGKHYPGQWVDVGTPGRLDALDRELRHRQAYANKSLL